MNVLRGNISSMKTSGRLTIVSVDLNDVVIKSIIIENPDTVSYLKAGNPIKAMFKETEVVLGRGYEIPVSMENQIEGKITKIVKGELLCDIDLDTKVGKITATLMSESVSKLKFKENETVTAMVKTTEIMLSE
jgi:molybdate transport system regulatory protein